MRPLSLLCCLAVLLFSSVSCSKDDEDDDNGPGNGNGSGEFVYDGETYTATKGFYYDDGADDTHYEQEFYITNGNINFDEEKIEANFLVYAELTSPGTDKFRTGTFEIGVGDDDSDFFADYADITIDSNNDNVIDENDDYFEAIEGTVVVTGNAPNYTLTFDLVLENGETLEGSYEGSFEELED